MRARREVFGLLGCSLLGVGVARAAEVHARGPSECPDSAELGFRLERSADVVLAEAPAMTFVVEMERSPSGYAARLTVGQGPGVPAKERSLVGADCEQLSDAVVVAMALALGAADASASPPPAAESASAHETASSAVNAGATASAGQMRRGSVSADTDAAIRSSPEGEARASAAAPDPDGATLRPALSVAALVDAGSLPAPGFGMALGAALGWKRLQLRALGSLLFEQHAELGGSRPAPGADLRLFAGSLHGCASAVGAGAFTLPICLGFELGWLAGVGTGVAAPRSGSAPWAAPRVDVGGRWCVRSSPVCLGLTLTAATPITRSRFALTEIGTVYRPAAVTGRLSFGVDVGFD